MRALSVRVAMVLVLLGAAGCGGAPRASDDVGAGSDAGADVDSSTDAAAVDGGGADAAIPMGAVPRAVTVARATQIPACTAFVDAAGAGAADGTAAHPYTTIAAAIAAIASGAVICVAEGTYAEALTPGTTYFTLAGGFQSGQGFTVRDSAIFPTRAQGDGTNTFLRVEDPGPTDGQLTAIDGLEITGYSQGIVRTIYYSQRFDVTNDFIHDNACATPGLVGGGFSLGNVSGTLAGNVIARNTCTRGGGGALDDSTNGNTVTIERNLVEANVGDEAGIAHGGGLYLFAHDLTLTGNAFTSNTATGWGGGLYVGAYSGGGQQTTAHLSWNVYRSNHAGGAGGGFFCDDSAHCVSDHELFDSNCGGNVYLDSGPGGADATVADFDHLTSVRALDVDCVSPGAGVQIDKDNTASDAYHFTNAIFWGNAPDRDFAASCISGCANVTVNVVHSDVQTTYANGGIMIWFGPMVLVNVDPRFVDVDGRDFHLRSTRGHYTPTGYVPDVEDSPALAVGDPSGELGTYGDSAEASR